MLGLGQEVEREQHGIGRVVGEDEALARALQHVRRHAVLDAQQLSDRDGRAAGPDDLAHARDRGAAEGRGGDAARAVDAPDLAQPELRGDVEIGRIDAARRSAAAV